MAGNSQPESRGNVFVEAAKEIPDAGVEFAKELWAHPEESISHAYQTLKMSSIMGGVMGYVLPARGPASWIIAAGLTAPLLWQAGHRLYKAHEDAEKPNADIHALGQSLARDTVRGGYDFGLNFVGGYAGAEAGGYLARSNSFIGRPAQRLHRGILKYENKALTAGVKALRRNSPDPITNPKLPTGTITTVEGAEAAAGSGATGAGSEAANLGSAAEQALIAPKPRIEDLPAWNGSKQLALIMQRVEQFAPETVPETVMVGRAPGSGREFILVKKANFHSHSNGSDGLGGHVKQIVDAEKAGYEVYGMSEHNHMNARDGVGKGHTGEGAGKSRFAGLRSYLRSLVNRGEKNAPDVVSPDTAMVSPVEAAVEPVTHGQVKVYGEDMILGTRKAPQPETTPQIHEAARKGHGKDPRIEDHAEHPSIVDLPILYAQQRADAARLTKPGKFVVPIGIEAGRISKGNHMIILELPELLVATKPQKTLMQRLFFREPEVKPPLVIEYADGNVKGLLADIRNRGLKDTSGGDPVFILAHPRNKPGDYGEANYRSRSAWVKDLDRNAHQIELISGPALTQENVSQIPSANIHFQRFIEYLDTGLHLSPVFGKDTHFANPGGTPAGTIMQVRQLTLNGVLEALRARRTGATTSSERLTGYMTGNDKHAMGSILDQTAVPDLNLKMHISGEITPEAQYTVRYWRDRKIGDKKPAEMVSEVEISGAQLLNQEGVVAFDGINHTLGNKSLHFMEVLRKDESGLVDKMWTAPIWIEPLSGARHTLYLRWLAGNAPSMLIPSGSPTGG